LDSNETNGEPPASESTSVVRASDDRRPDTSDNEDEDVPPIRPLPTRRRRLSTYESSDSVLDLEDDEIGGSARPAGVLHNAMGLSRSN
jgi:hypothetical protein